MEADAAGCWPEEDVFLLLISPHGAVIPGPHPTPMTDARKGAQRQNLRHRKPLRTPSVLGGLVAAPATKGRTRVV